MSCLYLESLNSNFNFTKLGLNVKHPNVLLKFQKNPYHRKDAIFIAFFYKKSPFSWLCETMQYLRQRGHPCTLDTFLVLVVLFYATFMYNMTSRLGVHLKVYLAVNKKYI